MRLSGRSRKAGGPVVGVILIVAGFGVHGWNERNSVRELRAIAEIEEVAIADVSAERIATENEAKVVHVVSQARTDDLVGLESFDITENAIRVSWDSDIYQLTESSTRRDGEREYEYDEEWTNEVVDSGTFDAVNRRSANDGSVKSLPADARSQATTVSFGAYSLSENLINQIDSDEPYPITSIPDWLQGQGTLQDGLFYTGNPNSPEIGDERIEFTIVGPVVDATVIAEQRSAGFQAYATESGKVKEILYVGSLSKAEVVSRQHSEARILRWILRLGGFLALWFGLLAIMEPFRIIARRIPLVGDVFEGVSALVAAGVAAVVSLLAIGVLWLTFRPLVAIPLLVLAGVVAVIAAVRSSRAAQRSRLERDQAVAAAASGRNPAIEHHKARSSWPAPSANNRFNDGKSFDQGSRNDRPFNDSAKPSQPDVFRRNPSDIRDHMP